LGALHLSVQRLLAFVLMALVYVLAVRPVTDPDFWWHLRAGRFIVETRSIPHTDIFSSTFFGREWVAHEWLSEALMYAVHSAFGYAGLVAFFGLVISAAMWIAYRRASSRVGHPYVAGFALLLGGLCASPTWGVRPQMFSFLFASIFVAVLDDYASGRNRRRVWLLVPLTLLWVNMHAGFALGLALIVLTITGLVLDALLSEKNSRSDEGRVSGGFEVEIVPNEIEIETVPNEVEVKTVASGVEVKTFQDGVEVKTFRAGVETVWRRVRTLAFVFAACVVAVALNPSGVRLYLYPFETLTSHAMMKYINEWFSPDFHQTMFQPLAVMLFATFAALALSSRRVRPGSLLLLAATGYMALRSGRNVPFFALVATPLLAEHVWAWLTRQSWGGWLLKPERREAGERVALKVALNLVLFVCVPLAVCVVRVQHVAARQMEDEAENFPVAAVEFIREHRPPQPIYNEYGWGGYMIWNLYPDYRVYIDGRADVYGDAYLEEFLKTHDGTLNWRTPLERVGVRTVVVNPEAPLASLLRQEGGWRNVFEDKQAVIFVRE
jgi:hypothetical protein